MAKVSVPFKKSRGITKTKVVSHGTYRARRKPNSKRVRNGSVT